MYTSVCLYKTKMKKTMGAVILVHTLTPHQMSYDQRLLRVGRALVQCTPLMRISIHFAIEDEKEPLAACHSQFLPSGTSLEKRGQFLQWTYTIITHKLVVPLHTEAWDHIMRFTLHWLVNYFANIKQTTH